jgi:hypothetical protein
MQSVDGIELYYESAGSGSSALFVVGRQNCDQAAIRS